MFRSLKRFSRSMTTMAMNPPPTPMIIVIGSTGTGKSKLAVSLASKYNGEIINADAIQMYRGLPIATNKIPESERNGIPHYLLDQIGFEENPWTVHEFVEETSKIISDIRARGKLPVVVGGTNYYVFSLIFEDSAILGDSENDDAPEIDDSIDIPVGCDVAIHPDQSILDESTEVMLAKLRELDPVMADSWHPKDSRKIRRSLEICLKTGRKASEIYEEQKSAKNQALSETSTPRLRSEPLIFWLEAENAVLKERLNLRVDAMVRDGLLDEVKEMRVFAQESASRGIALNNSKGVWIAIGYKELEPWLDACEQDSVDAAAISVLRAAGIEDVKSGTRQYAKRQNRWIRIRLAQHLKATGMLNKLFLLEVTDIGAWDETVTLASESITESYLSGQPLPENTSLSKLASQTFEHMQSQDEVTNRQARFCETCQKTLMTEKEWTTHMKGNRHKKIVAAIRKRAQPGFSQHRGSLKRQVTVDV